MDILEKLAIRYSDLQKKIKIKNLFKVIKEFKNTFLITKVVF